MTKTYQQSYSGLDGIAYMNSSQVAAYESERASLSSNKANEAKCTVLSQNITSISSNRRRLEVNFTKTLAVTYDLQVKKKKKSKIISFFDNYILLTASQHDQIKQFMINIGVQVEQVLNTTEIEFLNEPSIQPSIQPSSFQPTLGLVQNETFNATLNSTYLSSQLVE